MSYASPVPQINTSRLNSSDAPARLLKINEGLGNVRTELDEIEKRISVLGQRLGPVCSGMPPHGGGQANAKAADFSVHATLEEYRGRMADLNSYLGALLDALEV